MNIVVLGDTHIGAIFGLGKPNGMGSNTRVDDYQATLNYVVDYCIENKIDVFVQTGDVFEVRNPSPEHLSLFDSAIKRLSNAGITTVVLMGNHDYKRISDDNFTSSIVNLACIDYPNVRIVLHPSTLNVDKGGDSVNLVLLPYRDKRMYSDKSTEAASFGYENHVKSLIAECPKGTPVVTIGHNFYFEGSYNDFGGAEILARQNAFRGSDITVMGHYHSFRVVNDATPPLVYIGSMEKTNFGDKDKNKFFLDYNSETKDVKFIKMPVRELCEIEINLSESTIENYIEDLKEQFQLLDVKDKIIRVTIRLKERVVTFVKKNHIYDLCYDVTKCHFAASIKIEAIQARVVRDNSILKNKTDYSIFKAFLDKQDIDSAFRDELITESKKIMGA